MRKRTKTDRQCCELLSDFVYLFFEHNIYLGLTSSRRLWIAFRFCIFVLWTQWQLNLKSRTNGCELLSDFVYLFFEHNRVVTCIYRDTLWIAFRFCIFVLWTQCNKAWTCTRTRCELLSDFVYLFFEHNKKNNKAQPHRVVNCFQILYICSLNTITPSKCVNWSTLWIAFRFCIFVLWTQLNISFWTRLLRCELLSDFVYLFFEHNNHNFVS